MSTRKFAVIGLGRFGERLARALTEEEAEVIAIDRDPALVEKIRDEVTLAVRLDSTDAEALKAQGIDEVDAVIVGIGADFESAALTVATLKALKAKRIVARGQTEVQARILRSVGADDIVSPESESALRWAHRLTLPNLTEYVELGEGYTIVHMPAPRAFHNKTLKALMLRNKHGVNLVAIKRSLSVQADPKASMVTHPVISVPDGDTIILPGDILILVGSNESLSHLPDG